MTLTRDFGPALLFFLRPSAWWTFYRWDTGSSLGQGDPRNIALAFLNFILAAVGEELGVIGIVAVLLAFNLLCHHGNAYS